MPPGDGRARCQSGQGICLIHQGGCGGRVRLGAWGREHQGRRGGEESPGVRACVCGVARVSFAVCFRCCLSQCMGQMWVQLRLAGRGVARDFSSVLHRGNALSGNRARGCGFEYFSCSVAFSECRSAQGLGCLLRGAHQGCGRVCWERARRCIGCRDLRACAHLLWVGHRRRCRHDSQRATPWFLQNKRLR